MNEGWGEQSVSQLPDRGQRVPRRQHVGEDVPAAACSFGLNMSRRIDLLRAGVFYW